MASINLVLHAVWYLLKAPAQEVLALSMRVEHFLVPASIAFTISSVCFMGAAALSRASWMFFFARFHRAKQLLKAVLCDTVHSAASFSLRLSQSSSVVPSVMQKKWVLLWS